MELREVLTDYARGNDLRRFWRLYRRLSRAKHRLSRDVWAFLMGRCAHRHGGYVGPGAVFADIPSLPHGLHGVFISRYAAVGAGCRIYQNVTIGEVDGRAPAIGDGCLIGAGAVLIGGITVGSRARIGAGAVVSADVPADCTVVAQPPRVLAGAVRHD